MALTTTSEILEYLKRKDKCFSVLEENTELFHKPIISIFFHHLFFILLVKCFQTRSPIYYGIDLSP